MSWTPDSDVDFVRFLKSNFKGLPSRDRVSWDRVDIKAVKQAGDQEVQTVTGDYPSGTHTAT